MSGVEEWITTTRARPVDRGGAERRRALRRRAGRRRHRRTLSGPVPARRSRAVSSSGPPRKARPASTVHRFLRLGEGTPRSVDLGGWQTVDLGLGRRPEDPARRDAEPVVTPRAARGAARDTPSRRRRRNRHAPHRRLHRASAGGVGTTGGHPTSSLGASGDRCARHGRSWREPRRSRCRRCGRRSPSRRGAADERARSRRGDTDDVRRAAPRPPGAIGAGANADDASRPPRPLSRRASRVGSARETVPPARHGRRPSAAWSLARGPSRDAGRIGPRQFTPPRAPAPR